MITPAEVILRRQRAVEQTRAGTAGARAVVFDVIGTLFELEIVRERFR